jgi:hypothetical protein
MDDEEPLLDGLGGDLPVLHFLALDHLGAVARLFVLGHPGLLSCRRSAP